MIMNRREHQNDQKNVPTQHRNDTGPPGFNPFKAIARRRWQLLACLLLVCGIALVATISRKMKYEAVSRVQITADSPQVGGLGMLGGGLGALGGGQLNTQRELIQSRSVLTKALQNICQNARKDECKWKTTDEGLDELRNSLRVQSVGGSQLLDIVGIAPNPVLAARIANEVTNAFIDVSTEGHKESSARVLDEIHGQVKDQEDELRQQSDVVNTFREKHLITGDDRSLAAVEGRISTLEQNLTQLQIKRLNLESRREQIEKMLTTGRGLADDEATLEPIKRHPAVMALQNNIDQLKRHEVELAQVYLPGHEKLRNTRMQIAELQANLVDQKRLLLQVLADETTEEYAALAREEEMIWTMLNSQKELGVGLTERHTEYRSMLTDLELARRYREEGLAQARQFRLQKGFQNDPVVVVDRAVVPREPAGLSKAHQAASILLLGLLLSLAMVFVVDRFSTSSPLPYEQQMPMYIPIPPAAWESCVNAAGGAQRRPEASDTNVAATPAFNTTRANWLAWGHLGTMELGGESTATQAFAARCRIVHTDQRSAEAAAFRNVSSQLLSRFGQAHQAVVVTGIGSQGGKTTCATNLAMALAQTGRRVLLVDANAQRPALQNVFSLNHDVPDLLEALAGNAELSQTLQNTDTPNLDVLQQKESVEVAHIAGSEKLATVNAELIERYDWVVYDAGGIDASFTQSLLQGVGKALLISTDQEASQEEAAITQIERCGAVTIARIDNSFRTGRPVAHRRSMQTSTAC